MARAFDVTPDQAVALTAELLERESVVRVLGGTDVGSDQIRTRTGQIVPATSGDRRYTTTELLAAEERIVSVGCGTDRRQDSRGRPRPRGPGPANVTLT